MIDLTKLETVKIYGDKLTSACPACRVEQHDRSGNHLAIFAGDDGTFESGKFHCIKHDDSDHRKAIFSFIGVLDEQQPFNKEARKQYAIEQQRRERIELEKKRLTSHLQSTLEKRLAPYIIESWRAELFDRSPMHLDCIDQIPHDFIKCLFPLDSILWMGGVFDTGEEKHKANFKTAREWLELETLPQRIAPAHFREDSFSRSSVNVTTSPFIVLECDDIIGKEPSTNGEKERNKKFTSALALYAIDKLGLNLRAVIDTGNKSLHLWYDRPPPEALNAIRKMTAGLRIDAGVFDQSHRPLRMPHCIHDTTNKPAILLYLNHIKQS